MEASPKGPPTSQWAHIYTHTRLLETDSIYTSRFKSYKLQFPQVRLQRFLVDWGSSSKYILREKSGQMLRTTSRPYSNDVCRSVLYGAYSNDVCRSVLYGAYSNDVCRSVLYGAYSNDVCRSVLYGAYSNDVCRSVLYGAYRSVIKVIEVIWALASQGVFPGISISSRCELWGYVPLWDWWRGQCVAQGFVETVRLVISHRFTRFSHVRSTPLRLYTHRGRQLHTHSCARIHTHSIYTHKHTHLLNSIPPHTFFCSLSLSLTYKSCWLHQYRPHNGWGPSLCSDIQEISFTSWQTPLQRPGAYTFKYCDPFQEARRMLHVTSSQNRHLNVFNRFKPRNSSGFPSGAAV
jgi:hypothetical protein